MCLVIKRVIFRKQQRKYLSNGRGEGIFEFAFISCTVNSRPKSQTCLQYWVGSDSKTNFPIKARGETNRDNNEHNKMYRS